MAKIILCPGQGSQKPGMVTPWLDDDAAADFLRQAGETAGLDLVDLGTQADAETLQDTAVTQPLIAALSLAGALSAGLLAQPGNVVAGHSLGGLTALGVAGVLEPLEVVRLAAARGRAMAQCAAQNPGVMVALLGGQPAEVLSAIADAGMTPANINGAGQIVAAGTPQQFAAMQSSLPDGVRARSLPVAGAFHTQAMAAAEATFLQEVGSVQASAPACDLVDDATGELHPAGTPLGDVAQWVARKITRPVRWDLVSETLNGREVEQAVELPPAGVLSALARRGLTGAKCLPLRPAQGA